MVDADHASGSRWRTFNRFCDGCLPGLSRGALVTWCILFRHAKPDGKVRLSQARLGRTGGMSVATVRRAIRELERRGLLVTVTRGDRNSGPSWYIVHARERVPTADNECPSGSADERFTGRVCDCLAASAGERHYRRNRGSGKHWRLSGRAGVAPSEATATAPPARGTRGCGACGDDRSGQGRLTAHGTGGTVNERRRAAGVTHEHAAKRRRR
ncbi:MAG: helix-turn-helix domain-containing protein [Phycisphaerae bacterium]|nr:helix-turn-helix domain-containing protein [Phycisphaerae bacterium]